MTPDTKGRFRSLLAELEAICLWERIYLDSGRTPDEYDVVSYRARQERRMQLADELILIELELLGVTASTENTSASEANSQQASREAFPAAVLARWPSRSILPNSWILLYGTRGNSDEFAGPVRITSMKGLSLHQVSRGFVLAKPPVLEQFRRNILLIFVLANPFFQRQRVLVLAGADAEDSYYVIERSWCVHDGPHLLTMTLTHFSAGV
jgi:hypothetical protein